MKLLLAATVLLAAGTCVAGTTTTHHWLTKVPVRATNPHAKKVKGFNYKARPVSGRSQTKGKIQAVLTKVLKK